MQHQTEHQPVEKPVLEVETDTSHTQALNTTPNQRQRRYLTGKETEFSFSLKLYTVVHGWLDVDATVKKPASLIIVEARFIYKGSDITRRFRSAELHLSFKGHDGETPEQIAQLPQISKDGRRQLKNRTSKANPSVVQYAPFRKQEKGDENSISVEQERQFGAEGGLQFQPANFNLSANNRRTQNYQQPFFSTGSADLEYDQTTGLFNGAWWKLKENPNSKIKQRVGVRPEVLLAVLVERDSDAPFRGDFSIDIDAGYWESRGKKWKWASGTAVDDPIIYDPAELPFGEVEGVNDGHLAKYRNAKELAALATRLAPFGPDGDWSRAAFGPPAGDEVRSGS